jgi:glycosyltransferase involved in cell wall biosynthesis
MKKTLMIGLTPPLEGGSERHIYEVSSRLKCAVLTQNESICKNKIELPIIGSGYVKNFSFLLSSLVYAIYLLVKPKKEYDTIHIHENLLYLLIPLLSMRYKVVVTVHGIKGFKFYDNKKIWAIFKWFLRFAEKIIAVNIEDKKELEKYFKKVIYIPNGVDLSIYGKVKQKIENKIGFIGRVHEQKGIVYLIEAFQKIKPKFPGLMLEIIGKVDEYGLELKKKYNDNRIVWRGFLGDRDEIAKSLKSAYLIALPSLWEGLPLVLFEALASDRPVIVSNIPAYKSVIKDEAVFCKVKNSDDLAKKIEMLLKNKKLADKYGKRGFELSKKYDWDEIAKMLEKAYE